MSAQEVAVPDIGDFEGVDVIEVHVEVGQELQVDDPILTLENDKASMDIPATLAGIVKEVRVTEGDKVSRGDLILLLEVTGETTAPAPAASAAPPATEQPSPPPAVEVAPPPAPSAPPVSTASTPAQAPASKAPDFSKVHASPSIRRYAREQGVDLNKVRGTGRKGRITREDVLDFLAKGEVVNEGPTPASSSAAPAAGTGIPAVPAVDFSKFGPTETLELGRIKRLTAAAMTRSWLNIPHVTHNDEADVTELEAFRKSLKAEAEKRGTRVSILSFAMKAVVATLKAYPTFNASLDPSGENLILKQYYNIGIAVDTPNGLVVPVIRDVDRKSVYELSDELLTISKKARENKLKVSDIQGGTFTISSLGGIGGTTFSPIINAPEVAILGMTRSKMQPVWNGKEFVPRLMQPLSLSYDHRVIDGAEAARFCRHLGTLLNDIRRLVL